jgi:hypothetical protein
MFFLDWITAMVKASVIRGFEQAAAELKLEADPEATAAAELPWAAAVPALPAAEADRPARRTR